LWFGLGFGLGRRFVGFDFGIGQILSLESGIIAPIRGKCEAPTGSCHGFIELFPLPGSELSESGRFADSIKGTDLRSLGTKKNRF